MSDLQTLIKNIFFDECIDMRESNINDILNNSDDIFTPTNFLIIDNQ